MLPAATPVHGVVVLDVAAVVELVAPEVLDVASVLDDVAAVVVLVELLTEDDGVPSGLDDGRCWKISSRTTVSASTPSTTPTATMISCRLRIGAPCAFAALGTAAVTHLGVPVIV